MHILVLSFLMYMCIIRHFSLIDLGRIKIVLPIASFPGVLMPYFRPLRSVVRLVRPEYCKQDLQFSLFKRYVSMTFSSDIFKAITIGFPY